MKRLATRTGLDMNALEVTTTSVTFDKNLAYATVAIHPKDTSDITKGMSMKYTLEQRDGGWVVLDPTRPLGDRVTPGPEGRLPPGHPPTSSTTVPQSNSHAPEGTDR